MLEHIIFVKQVKWGIGMVLCQKGEEQGSIFCFSSRIGKNNRICIGMGLCMIVLIATSPALFVSLLVRECMCQL